MPGSTLICCMKRSSSERKHQRFKGKSPNIIPSGVKYTYFVHIHISELPQLEFLFYHEQFLYFQNPFEQQDPRSVTKFTCRTLCSSVLCMAEIQGGSWYWYLIPLFALVLAPSFRWWLLEIITNQQSQIAPVIPRAPDHRRQDWFPAHSTVHGARYHRP